MDLAHQQLPSEVRNWIGRQLFEHVPNNIVVIDRDHRVVVANSSFRQVFGETDGKHCYELYKRRNTVCSDCMAALTFEDGKVRVTDEEGVDKEGRPAHYVVHIAPVYDEIGEIAHVIEMSYDVTETKSLQREYNILFERMPCYIAVINRDLRIVRANAMLRDRFGDTVGEPCYEVYKHRTERCPDCPAMKVFADGRAHRAEQVGLDKHGDVTHYVVSATPLSRGSRDFSHVIEMSIDVTDQHRLSAELVRQSTFRDILIGSSLDAVVAVDESGMVHLFNSAAERLFKVPACEVVGKCHGRRFLPEDFLEAMKAGKPHLSLPEAVVTDSAGEQIPIRVSGSALRDGERTIGGAAFLQDLRELKRLEREKLENERLAAVGQTIAQMSHGIKNILTGLRGGIYVARSGMRSGSEKRTLKGWDMLDRNVDRITALVRGFLRLSKKYTPSVRGIDPRELAEEICMLFKETGEQCGVTVRLETPGEMAEANLEPEGMHSCLANLVSNAIDACRSSKKKSCTVTLRVKDEDGTLIFEVEDTADGMDEEVRAKVFTSFFTTKGLAGNGLGLLITRKIVSEHGGRVRVESTLGEGSVFCIELPRAKLPREVVET